MSAVSTFMIGMAGDKPTNQLLTDACQIEPKARNWFRRHVARPLPPTREESPLVHLTAESPSDPIGAGGTLNSSENTASLCNPLERLYCRDKAKTHHLLSSIKRGIDGST